MYVGLSLEQAPPFKAVLRFFLTAPIFASIFSIFVFFSSSTALYSFKTIALVHLFTLGFILMVIIASLMQMLPVVAGAVIKDANKVSNFTYYTLIFGIISFFLGFYFYNKILLLFSSLLLLFSIIYFFSLCLYKLLKVKNKSMIIKGMIFSLSFALFAILLGLHLEISHARQNLSEFYTIYSTLHYNYIFVGFVFLLIVAISFQVVPMFWVTNPYSTKKQKFIIYFTLSILSILSIFTFLEKDFDLIYKISLFFITSYFAYETLKIILSRKRKLKDLSVYFYITSMIFLILGSIFLLSYKTFDLKLELLGVLWGLGFIVSLMNGMLYKIVPFLAWFHLSSKGFFDIPTIRDMIPLKHIQNQYYLHLLAIIFFCLYFLFYLSIFLKLAAVFLFASNFYLFINLFKAIKIYYKVLSKENK